MVSWYLTTNHKVPTLSRRHTLGVPHIKYVVDLSTLCTVPHSVQYHTSWDTHYICGQVGHTWCSTTLPHGRVWPQRPIVDTFIIITWVTEWGSWIIGLPQLILQILSPMIGSLLANVQKQSLRYYMVLLGITSAHARTVRLLTGQGATSDWGRGGT